ncbi:MAG: DUF3516 domain-containing protein [Deltaproteobacteria bacterium]|nr:MAG: DUF3516 domain-containing protein [Deltaproteobacteria bacterium]
MSLSSRIPDGGFAAPEDALDAFLDWVSERGLTLYDHQEEAILELFEGKHVLLKTPTGSGKSMVATAMHFRELALGHRSVYTAPIKALVSEKFLALCEIFGAENVGMSTGDGAVNQDAPILCCTAEVLAQIALRLGEDTPFEGVVMDEFHYYGDRDRGMAWQLPLLTMTHARFLLMSATLGDTSAIETDLVERTGTDIAVVRSAQRPVPLTFLYSEIPVDDRLSQLVRSGESPVYAVHFTQRAATERAQALLSTDFCSKEEKEALKHAVKGFRFDSPFGATLRRMILHGVAVHHAGLLPKYRMLVEKLSQQGSFKVICGTDTLGVGINVPIRSVLFTQLCKFDGEKTDLLSVRDFLQIAGRAGRKGFDDHGTVVAQAPDWVIENAKIERAIEEGRKKRNKAVKKSAPTRGYKHWDAEIYERMYTGRPEALTPRFSVDHGFVLRLLQKAEETLDDPMAELDALIERSHVTRREREEAAEAGRQRLEELVTAGVVTDAGEEAVPRYRVDPNLQDDFSLHHALSVYLLHVLKKLDPAHPAFSYHVITLVESILEHPRAVLSAQVNREKTEAVAQMKADGVPYEDRLEALEAITWPKPMAEWIYADFNAWREHYPWIPADPIRPKSIVREMLETQAVFSQYVKGLRLERSEGVLLRYISQVYKTLAQNVPEELRTPELVDAIATLRAMLARVDDSLLQTWEALMDPSDPGAEAPPVDISADEKSFRARIRAELHNVLRALADGDWDEAAASVRDTDDAWTADEFKAAVQPWIDERGPIIADGRARLGNLTVIEKVGPHLWEVQQVFFDDEDEDSDKETWSIKGRVDLREDTDPHGPIVQVYGIGD